MICWIRLEAAPITMSRGTSSIRFAAVVLFVGACAVGCHGGDLDGTGSACSASLPCRSAFVCVDGRCAVDTHPANNDATATADATDAVVDGPAGPIVAPDAASDAAGDAASDAAPEKARDAETDTSEARDAGEDVTDAWDAPDARDVTDAGDGPKTFDAGADTREDAREDTHEAGADAASGHESSCDPQAPFVAIAPVTGLDDDPAFATVAYDDRNGRLSADERTIYFGSNRSNGDFLVYSATRATSTGAFGAPQPVTSINDDYTGSPTVTANGLTMYLDSTRAGQWAIWLSTRATADATWSTPVSLVAQAAFVDTAAEAGPYVLPDGNTLYFHSNRLDGSNHLYRTRRTSQAFAAATLLSSTVSSAQEVQAVVSPDDLTLYFGTNRLDGASKGGYDIWVSSRASTADDFGPPHDVQELNTAGNEFASWISADQCRLYFERNGGAVGRFYVASRQTPAATDGGRD
jgi:hypothetical protein